MKKFTDEQLLRTLIFKVKRPLRIKLNVYAIKHNISVVEAFRRYVERND